MHEYESKARDCVVAEELKTCYELVLIFLSETSWLAMLCHGNYCIPERMLTCTTRFDRPARGQEDKWEDAKRM